MQQIQQLRGADDNPRIRMNTGDSQHRDPYLTLVFGPVFDRIGIRARDAAVKDVLLVIRGDMVSAGPLIQPQSAADAKGTSCMPS